MEKKVKVYSTPICPQCISLKQFLDEKGIKYEDIDVSKDKKAAEEMIKKSGQMGVPVIEIDGKIVDGFDQEKISQLLGL